MQDIFLGFFLYTIKLKFKHDINKYPIVKFYFKIESNRIIDWLQEFR